MFSHLAAENREAKLFGVLNAPLQAAALHTLVWTCRHTKNTLPLSSIFSTDESAVRYARLDLTAMATAQRSGGTEHAQSFHTPRPRPRSRRCFALSINHPFHEGKTNIWRFRIRSPLLFFLFWPNVPFPRQRATSWPLRSETFLRMAREHRQSHVRPGRDANELSWNLNAVKAPAHGSAPSHTLPPRGSTRLTSSSVK